MHGYTLLQRLREEMRLSKPAPPPKVLGSPLQAQQMLGNDTTRLGSWLPILRMARLLGALP